MLISILNGIGIKMTDELEIFNTAIACISPSDFTALKQWLLKDVYILILWNLLGYKAHKWN